MTTLGRMIAEEHQKEMDEKIKEVTEQISEQTAKDMLMDNEPLEKVKKYSHLSEDVIVNLAASMGVTANR